MTTTEERTWESLWLDERRALTNAAERLAAEFEPRSAAKPSNASSLSMPHEY
ncbi:hypothetical protein [Tessaracoccus flavescens]|uniref:hypothetical protein n=1 Tax=Tessaracoccus flavescens TaxID=399497 RepID=UPI0013747E8D|nr:hypothetical protein [Tessaracoccus flavescens]